jgi:hypothetical protein
MSATVCYIWNNCTQMPTLTNRVGFLYALTKPETKPMPLIVKEMATIDDVDEALGHLRQIPPGERGPAWQAYTDKLLEIRQRHTQNTGALTPAFIGPNERAQT